MSKVNEYKKWDFDIEFEESINSMSENQRLVSNLNITSI